MTKTSDKRLAEIRRHYRGLYVRCTKEAGDVAFLLARIGEQADTIAELKTEATGHDELIDLIHSRSIEAENLWRAAHPARDVWPDLGELLTWLLGRLRLDEDVVEAVTQYIRTDADREWRKVMDALDRRDAAKGD